MERKKKVYICSPLRGNYERNVANARLFCRAAIKKGYIPIAPHLYFPQFLDDASPKERAEGIKYGLEALESCDEIWVFEHPISGASEDMQTEMMKAAELSIPIYEFDALTAAEFARAEMWRDFYPLARLKPVKGERSE